MRVKAAGNNLYTMPQKMAAQISVELMTDRLTGDCSATELLGNESGRGDRIRTYDLLVPNQALYQTKLHPDKIAYSMYTATENRTPITEMKTRCPNR